MVSSYQWRFINKYTCKIARHDIDNNRLKVHPVWLDEGAKVTFFLHIQTD